MPKKELLKKMIRKNPESPRITSIGVGGFKSIGDKQTIEIRPLTILAGANSSGKSSIMQPLLLMKQTVEAPFDPGVFLLDGPILNIASAETLFSKDHDRIVIEFETGSTPQDTTIYRIGYVRRMVGVGVDISEFSTTYFPTSGRIVKLYQGMPAEEFLAQLSKKVSREVVGTFEHFHKRFRVARDRCFLEPTVDGLSAGGQKLPHFLLPVLTLQALLRCIVYLPGLRGNPEREYQRTAVRWGSPGVFSPYVASIVDEWQQQKDAKLQLLGRSLEELGLTWKVEAHPIKDAHIELHVPRTKNRSKTFRRDMVNIADVGLGVSQALPVLVALLAADPDQMVYIEQPEIHLHPRAQVAMARILADAAKRGVRVVAETHSSLLLLGIQTLVAQGYLSPDLVKLHWFELDKQGFTKITSSNLDEAGRFDTNWPEDFADVELKAQSRYLDESEKRLAGS